MKKIFILLAILILTGTCIKAAELDTEAILQYNQGIDFYKTGQYDKSIDAFRSAIKLDPNYIDAYYNLGSVLEFMNQDEAALAVFKQIIVRQPNDYDSVYKAALLSAHLGQYDKAKTYLSIIPKNCPRATDAQELSGKISSHVVVKAPQSTQAKSNSDKSDNLYQDFAGPTGITTDTNGNLYIAGFNDNTVTKITPDEKRTVFLKDTKIDGPIGLAMDKVGNMYIANYNKDNVLKVSNLGEISVLIGNVKKPYYLYVQGNTLFVSSQGSNSVLRYKLGN